MSEHLACHRTVGASIVMLIASGLAGSEPARFPGWAFPLPAASSSGGPKGPAFLARLIRRRPVPSGGRFGSEDPLLPPGGSVTVLQRVVPVLPFRDAEASLPFRPFRPPLGDLTAPRHSLHLRFARFVPGNAPSVFSDAAAGIVAVSISFSFPFPFQRFPVETSSSVSSSRQGDAATQNRVAQAESARVIHRCDESPWTSRGIAVSGLDSALRR